MVWLNPNRQVELNFWIGLTCMNQVSFYINFIQTFTFERAPPLPPMRWVAMLNLGRNTNRINDLILRVRQARISVRIIYASIDVINEWTSRLLLNRRERLNSSTLVSVIVHPVNTTPALPPRACAINPPLIDRRINIREIFLQKRANKTQLPAVAWRHSDVTACVGVALRSRWTMLFISKSRLGYFNKYPDGFYCFN